jgi:hypothetical protein
MDRSKASRTPHAIDENHPLLGFEPRAKAPRCSSSPLSAGFEILKYGLL